MDQERREIPGWPNYSVTRDGQVWSDEKFRRKGDGWLKQTWHGGPGAGKYLAVYLHKDGKDKWRSVHTLCLEVWIGSRPKGMQGLHKDDNPAHNYLDNLKWGTPSENNRMRKSIKLTEQDIWHIHELRDQGFTHKAIANQVGITQSMVGFILQGNRWSDIHAQYLQSKGPKP